MSRSIKDVLNESNPNKLPSGAQVAQLGNALGLAPRFAAGAVAASILALASDAKASLGLTAFATAAGSTGAKTFVIGGAPVAGEFSIDPKGDIIFAAADAVTAAEVTYLSVEGELFTDELAVAASSAALSSGRGALVLISTEVISGIIPGTKTIAARASAPAAGSAAVSLLGTAISFNAADVVTGTCRVTYVVKPGTGGTSSLATRLAGTANF